MKFTQLELGSPARSKDEIIRLFERAITNSRFRPKVLLICHINFTTGLRMPVKELCQLARKHDMISIVDGAHALGMLKLDLHDMGCDFYSTAGHKWLNCVPGTGVLYMKGGEANTRNLWPVLSEFYDFRDEDGNLYDIATQMQLRVRTIRPPTCYGFSHPVSKGDRNRHYRRTNSRTQQLSAAADCRYVGEGKSPGATTRGRRTVIGHGELHPVK